jgi:phage N-6-adenine-methyltransferase
MADYISSELSSNEKDSWSTPDWLFNALHHEFFFRLDVCATKENAKTSIYITEEQNALTMANWKNSEMYKFVTLANKFVWINPPYSRGMIKAFIDKAYEQLISHKICSVILVPATPDAGWWPKNATEIRFITGGRVSFINPVTKQPVNGNTKGSALIIFKHMDLGHGTVTRYVDRDRLRELGEEVMAGEVEA